MLLDTFNHVCGVLRSNVHASVIVNMPNHNQLVCALPVELWMHACMDIQIVSSLVFCGGVAGFMVVVGTEEVHRYNSEVKAMYDTHSIMYLGLLKTPMDHPLQHFAVASDVEDIRCS